METIPPNDGMPHSPAAQTSQTRPAFGAPITDTGLWRLTVCISARGVQAWLSPKDGADGLPASESVRCLLDASWPEEPDGLMQRISNVVYDNPGILDDYAASVIIDTPSAILVPVSELEGDGAPERLCTSVFNVKEEDVMVDMGEGVEGVLFTLTPGMLGFLRRTFPGARLHSHLGLLKERLRHRGTGPRIFADMREGRMDLLVFNGPSLLSVSSQPWEAWTDALWRILNAADLFGLELAETEIALGGPAATLEELKGFLSPRVAAVRSLRDPALPETLPFHASLVL